MNPTVGNECKGTQWQNYEDKGTRNGTITRKSD